MKWYKFSDCIPEPGFEILILNYFRDEDDVNSLMEPRYFICNSEDYKYIMDKSYLDPKLTYWCKLTEPV